MLAPVSLLALVGIVYLGAFSRFTNGRYTPGFYAYQLDRAPNEGYARLIPVVDASVATLLLSPKARPWTALFCAVTQGGAILARVREGKAVVPDTMMFGTAVIVFWTSL